MHTILHIGAGQASDLPELLKTGAENITLVEPNPELAEQLRQRTAKHPEVTVVEAAVTTNSANNQLQEFNLSEASSLHPATGLKTIFPGLKVNATHTVETLSPDQLLAKHGPQQGRKALLAIEVPGEEHALLKSLMNTDQLKGFSELRLNANPTPYFKGSVAAENTLQALVDYGYQVTDDNQLDPDWPSWQLARDPLKDQIDTLRSKNGELTASIKQLKEALQETQQQKAEAVKLNEQLKQTLEQEGNKISELTIELESVKKKLEAQQITNTKLDELEKRIANVGNNLTTDPDNKLLNAVKQVENTLALQNYFSTGDLPPNNYGWSIDTDLALYLTEKLENNTYDLVIEFGSGNSTVLFAKILLKMMMKNREENTLPNDTDLPKRILTFEHNKHYHEQTTAMLRQAELDDMVNLVYAPLVDYSYQDEDYLYYDCDAALANIANLYETKTPNVLVLIDGPPADTGLNARFPALPKLLNHLSTATFDLILDDYNRSEEKVVAANWLDLIKKRALHYTEQKIPLSRGAVCISIGAVAN